MIELTDEHGTTLNLDRPSGPGADQNANASLRVTEGPLSAEVELDRDAIRELRDTLDLMLHRGKRRRGKG